VLLFPICSFFHFFIFFHFFSNPYFSTFLFLSDVVNGAENGVENGVANDVLNEEVNSNEYIVYESKKLHI